MSNDVEENKKLKLKRRSKTTEQQYEIYLRETVNPTLPENYMVNTWENLAIELNAVDTGPSMTAKQRQKLDDFNVDRFIEECRAVYGVNENADPLRNGPFSMTYTHFKYKSEECKEQRSRKVITFDDSNLVGLVSIIHFVHFGNVFTTFADNINFIVHPDTIKNDSKIAIQNVPELPALKKDMQKTTKNSSLVKQLRTFKDPNQTECEVVLSPMNEQRQQEFTDSLDLNCNSTPNTFIPNYEVTNHLKIGKNCIEDGLGFKNDEKNMCISEETNTTDNLNVDVMENNECHDDELILSYVDDLLTNQQNQEVEYKFTRILEKLNQTLSPSINIENETETGCGNCGVIDSSTRIDVNQDVILVNDTDNDSDIEILDVPCTSRITRSRRRRALMPRNNAKKQCITSKEKPISDHNESEILQLPDLKEKQQLPDSREKQSLSLFTHDCPICLEPLRNNEVSSTQCGHIFCTSCIKDAVKKLRSCPNCRKRLNVKQIHPLFL
ncbi:hypothetical protein FQA39_LY03236 [Lamprigera yunnana]|nr:hypothetical protein FQA39_LY03236 [Lamprigera yunnana]